MTSAHTRRRENLMAGFKRTGKRRTVAAALLVAALSLAACSSASESDVGGEAESVAYDAAPATTIAMSMGDEAMKTSGGNEVGNELIAAAPIGTDVPIGLKVIRDGRVDLRVEPGAFDQVSSQLRSIAVDLGGYITSGETYLQEVDGVDYTVGWMTMRIPEDRFDDALARVDGIGERLSLNVSSQDVTEEYVDLEGRLRYWKSQEEFYTRLMSEATEINDLVTIQTRMQDVMLNIEQTEGRLRYLDSRTDFSTLTVGLTEVPDTATVVDPGETGIIEGAIDQAGTVLLATIGGLIVGAAFVLPFALLVGLGLLLWLAIRAIRRRKKTDGSRPSEE
jgi:hypothetical protein